jgi:1-hydroxycarotenoid 3,4-desaturase
MSTSINTCAGIPALRVVVVGAGIGGLVAAARLAHAGLRVTLLERATAVGGKLRTDDAGGRAVDAGPTVFTLRPWFEALFDDLGERFDAHVTARPLAVLARHAWRDGSRLDLHADARASADAIGAFAGAGEARRYVAFCERSRGIFDALEHTFMRASRPTPWSLPWRAGWRGLPALAGISPFARLMDELARAFRDPRLRQLFGRYATYCGSSPYAAPATLMLVAHAERLGVWCIDGGMGRLAAALAGIARARGATVRCGAHVARLLVQGGRACGVALADGERIDADVVVWNGDAAALAQGLAGDDARRAVPRDAATATRSLSATTWSALARVDGFDLGHHNVFFADDGAAEFCDLFDARRLPRGPTVYVCAQDRSGAERPQGEERLFWLVNAPAAVGRPAAHIGTDPGAALADEEIDACERRTLDHLNHCGLRLTSVTTPTRTTPHDFHARFPGTGGALYGRATHGWMTSFRRPGSASQIPGLWLAGGSVHPGPGLPMAATSGWLAAQAILGARPRSRISIAPSPATATPGGTSMR